MSTSIRKEIRWHDRMEARVAAGILLLVTLSLAAVVVDGDARLDAQRRRPRRRQPRGRAVGVLPSRRRARGIRGATDAPHHRASALPIDDDQSGHRERCRDAHRDGRKLPAEPQRAVRDRDVTGRTPIGDAGMAAGAGDARLPAGGHSKARRPANRDAISCRSTAS